MNTYAIYATISGEIVRLYIGGDPAAQIGAGEAYVACTGNTSGETHWVNDGVLTAYTQAQVQEKHKEWFVGESWSNATMSWQIDDATLLNSELMQALRTKRDELLASSDYTQMPDVTLTNQSAWDTYRQALRDLPQTYSTITSLDDVTWPTPP